MEESATLQVAWIESSLAAARAASTGTLSTEPGTELGTCTVLSQQFLPWDKQKPVTEEEKIFEVCDGRLYIGSEFGAINSDVFEAFGITAVINVTAGSRAVPNVFSADNGGLPRSGRAVAYLHLPCTDSPGEAMAGPMQQAICAIDNWFEAGPAAKVFVHCSAGLSRSATIILAWLMSSKNMNLAAAVELLTNARGRQLQCNPSFWLDLARWECKLSADRGSTPGDKDACSFDFRAWWHEDFGRMGFDAAKIDKAFDAATAAGCDWSIAESVLFD
jgi:hypothetical protein